MTQPEAVINELERRKGLFGIKAWISIRDIELMGINSAYSVMKEVKQAVRLIQDVQEDMRSNKLWKIWRLV